MWHVSALYSLLAVSGSYRPYEYVACFRAVCPLSLQSPPLLFLVSHFAIDFFRPIEEAAFLPKRCRARIAHPVVIATIHTRSRLLILHRSFIRNHSMSHPSAEYNGLSLSFCRFLF